MGVIATDVGIGVDVSSAGSWWALHVGRESSLTYSVLGLCEVGASGSGATMAALFAAAGDDDLDDFFAVMSDPVSGPSADRDASAWWSARSSAEQSDIYTAIIALGTALGA